MDISLDILEYIVMGIWILIVLFGSKLFQKNKTTKPQYEYPSFPDEKESDSDISAEEEKLKEWLENVFGTKESHEEKPKPVEKTYKQPKAKPTTPYNSSASAIGKIKTESLAKDSVTLNPVATALVKEKPSLGQGKIGKKQMAYGMLMAEIFARPRALRPIQRMPFKNFD